ncbi:MAG TPA: hypothetical protein VN175_15490 [Rhizomicrobium sp.]|nr:hypothetical protein [Rhizomicrobium sp.]
MRVSTVKSLTTSIFALSAALCLPGAASAAGSYYVGTTVASNSVLWVYAPTTNLVKLCFSTTAGALACTATKPVFSSIPLATDALQYRISQNSLTGGFWILNMTTNKQALCEAKLTDTYYISCVPGAGIK